MDEDIRTVARVVIYNATGETFLLRGRDSSLPDRAPFWFTVGGKIDLGETPLEAASRELFEEVGLSCTPDALGEVIGHEDSQYHFEGVAYRQHGVFYALEVADVSLNAAGWSEVEARTIDQGRWWSLNELKATSETIYPTHLAEMLATIHTTRLFSSCP
jgi:8-oxo-dGTP pyrophosphatase MutT (NUDIX family)